MGRISQVVYDGGRHVLGYPPFFFFNSLFFYLYIYIYICIHFVLMILPTFLCRVIPKTLMLREVRTLITTTSIYIWIIQYYYND